MALYELDGVRVETPGEGRYWVAPNAIVIGKVIIEEDASVWFGSVLRGDCGAIVVGERSNCTYRPSPRSTMSSTKVPVLLLKLTCWPGRALPQRSLSSASSSVVVKPVASTMGGVAQSKDRLALAASGRTRKVAPAL